MTKCKFQKPDGRCKNKGTTTYDGYCKRHYDIVQRESESKEEIELQEVPDLDLSDNSVQNSDNQQHDEPVEDLVDEPIATEQEEEYEGEGEAIIEDEEENLQQQIDQTKMDLMYQQIVNTITEEDEYDEEPAADEQVQSASEVEVSSPQEEDKLDQEESPLVEAEDDTVEPEQADQAPSSPPLSDEQLTMNDQEHDELEVEIEHRLVESSQQQKQEDSESNVIIEEEDQGEQYDESPVDDSQVQHILEEEPSQQVTEEVQVVEMIDPYTVPIEQPTEVIEETQENEVEPTDPVADAYESLKRHLVQDVTADQVDESDYERQEIVRSKSLSTSSTAVKARGHRTQVKIPEPKGILKADKPETTRSAKRVRFDDNVKTKRISPPAERVAKVKGLEVVVEEKQPEVIDEPKVEAPKEVAPVEEVEEQEIPSATATSDWVLTQADRKKTLSLLALNQASKKAGAAAVFVPDYKEAIRLAYSRDGHLLLNSFAAGFMDQWVSNFHNRTFHLTESLSIKVTGSKSIDLLKQKLTTTHHQLSSYAASLEESNALLINEPKFVFYVASHPLHWRPEESEGTGTLDRYLWCTTSIKDAVNKANSCERHWKPVLVIIRVLSGKYTIPFTEQGAKKGKLLLLPQNNIKWVSSRPHQSKPGEMSHRIFEGDANVVGPHVSLYKLTVSN
uniref:Uncharacterized protein n=1 Tax=Clandestinovirus TaxID=2831644 RepID=A0A8F8KTA0_9VIRU|nr:hypothetical protein KOM_12_392 [Clandestinovirus]